MSVAFDLPTQTGYDPDAELARGEVGKVGVPIAHIGDMRALFDGIPLQHMNTSMTINAPAMWLLALYLTAAEEQGADIAQLAGTTQNDIIKEYLSRGTYVFPPVPSLRLITDMITYTVHHVPRWNPINVCSYHLQEAGATPVQEVAFALGTAIAVLDAVRASGQVDERDFGAVVGRISFFVNAGVRFVEEMCKLRAFGELWDEITRDRYGVTDPNQRRFRYGVQVNSLGLTETQPENNVTRILLEMLAVTLSRDARARAVQLPTWNEALGLPRPWDQQWSLRMQQVLAFESDLLEYEDLFTGSPVVEAKVAEIAGGARRRDRPRVGHGRRGRGRRVRLPQVRAGVIAGPPPSRYRGGQHRCRRTQPVRWSRSRTRYSPTSIPRSRRSIRPSRPRRSPPSRRGGRPGIRRRLRRRWSPFVTPPRPTRTSCRPRWPAPAPGSPPANGRAYCERFSASIAHRPASLEREA